MTKLTSIWKPRYFDIGLNVTDSMFLGKYYGSSSLTPKHGSHIQLVTERAVLFNVKNMLITSSSIEDSKKHLLLCDDKHYHTTVGVHPCSVAQEFYIQKEIQPTEEDEDQCRYTDDLISGYQSKLSELSEIAHEGYSKGYIKAYGEIGLDYDRLHYSSKVQQIAMFKAQLNLFDSLGLDLPYFLHMRAACDDFIDIIKPYVEKGLRGVVHSFTGTEDELNKLLSLGFMVGINGCSLRTDENIEVASKIPISKLMIETDAPYCEIRKNNPAGKKYLTNYPNKFYPQFDEKIQQELDELKQAVETYTAQDTRPKKQRNGGITFSTHLPLPIVKSSNVQPYDEIAQSLIKDNSTSIFRSPDGPFYAPIILSRNEPVFVGQIAQIMSSLHGLQEDKEIEDFVDTVYKNTCDFFKIDQIE